MTSTDRPAAGIGELTYLSTRSSSGTSERVGLSLAGVEALEVYQHDIVASRRRAPTPGEAAASEQPEPRVADVDAVIVPKQFPDTVEAL